jgi:hypothetical protein
MEQSFIIFSNNLIIFIFHCFKNDAYQRDNMLIINIYLRSKVHQAIVDIISIHYNYFIMKVRYNIFFFFFLYILGFSFEN